MIVWSWGSQSKDLGHLHMGYCPNCNADRGYHLLLRYSYFTLYWCLPLVTRKQYYRLCGICNQGHQLKPAELKTMLEPQHKKNLSIWQQYGLLLFFGGLSGVGTVISLVGAIVTLVKQ
jgi:hypothetical protein